MQQMYKVFIDDKVVLLTNHPPQDEVSFGETIVDCNSGFFAKAHLHPFLNDPQKHTLWLYNTDNADLLFDQFSSNFKPVMAAGGLVTTEDGTILFIFRHGKWDLPKGKPIAGEAPPITALREVEEETGVTSLQVGKLISKTYHIYTEDEQHFLKTSYWFAMQSQSKQPLRLQTCEGITDARWVHPDELESILEGAYSSIRELVADFHRKN